MLIILAIMIVVMWLEMYRIVKLEDEVSYLKDQVEALENRDDQIIVTIFERGDISMAYLFKDALKLGKGDYSQRKNLPFEVKVQLAKARIL